MKAVMTCFLLVGLLTYGCIQPEPSPEPTIEPTLTPSGNGGFGQPQGCTLMKNRQSGEVACFGCAKTVCKTPTPDFEPYKPSGVGIPYACFVGDNGCELAQ